MRRIAKWREFGNPKGCTIEATPHSNQSRTTCISLSCHLLAISVLASEHNYGQPHPVQAIMQVHGLAQTNFEWPSLLDNPLSLMQAASQKKWALLMEEPLVELLNLSAAGIYTSTNGVALALQRLHWRNVAQEEFVGNMLAQVVLSLAQLQESMQFTHGNLIPANLVLQMAADVEAMPIANAKTDAIGDENPDDVADAAPAPALKFMIGGKTMSLPNLGYVTKILLADSCAITINDRRFVPSSKTKSYMNQLASSFGYRSDSLRRVAQELIPGEVNAQWDLATLMCQSSRTEDLDMWRHPLGDHYFDADFRLQAIANGITSEDRFLNDSLEDRLLRPEFFDRVLSIPSSQTRLTARAFAELLTQDGGHRLCFPPTVPAQAIQSSVPQRCQTAKDCIDLGAGFLTDGRNSVKSWLRKIGKGSTIYLTATPEDIERNQLFVTLQEDAQQPLDATNPCFITKGKGGGEIFRAKR